MLIWMFYVVVVTLLLSGAAFCAERASRIRPGCSRWVWLISIVASLLLPVLISSVAIQVPSIVAPTTIEKVIPLNTVTSSTLSPLHWFTDSSSDVITLGRLDPLLKQAWLATSLLLAIGLAASALYLMRRKSGWRSETVNGVEVYVTRDVGPAIAGLLKPRIVVPEWILQAPPSRRALVLAHEQSHLDAGDQKLLTVSLCLLVFMPWNLPLWWQLRRLRRAIEVDCDTRVLQQGHSVTSYGETLIEVGQRQSAFVGAVAAMSESLSFLEQRIRIMTDIPTRLWKISVVVFAVLSFALFATAAQISPPNTGSDPTARPEVTLPVTILDRYVGFYQLDENTVLTITRSEQQLYIQVTGQPAFELYAESEATFFLKVVEANVKFIAADAAPATSLELHQDGVHKAQRIDAVTAEQIEAKLSARVQAQVPTAGTEAALRKLISGIMSGTPDYSDMVPQLATAVEQQLPMLQPGMQKAGAIQSVEFRSVGNQGWDVYEVRHQNGVTIWRITLNADGKVAGALVQPGP